MAGLRVPAQPSGKTGLEILARSSKEDPQAAETARGRVPRQRTGADCLGVAMKPGNAGGAKQAGCPGWSCGPTTVCGRSLQGCPQPGTAAWAPPSMRAVTALLVLREHVIRPLL